MNHYDGFYQLETEIKDITCEKIVPLEVVPGQCLF